MKTDLEQDLETCSAVIAASHAGFFTAGQAIAGACDRHTGFIDALHKVLRGSVSIAYLRRLERCGRGELIPDLVICVGPAQTWLEKLSVQDQKEAIKGIPWPVGEDDTDTRIKLVSDLSYSDGKACFSGGVIAAPSTIRVKALVLMAAAQSAVDTRRRFFTNLDAKDRKHRAKMSKLGVAVYATYITCNGVKLTEDELTFLCSEMDRMKS